jgi:hypothetical protein
MSFALKLLRYHVNFSMAGNKSAGQIGLVTYPSIPAAITGLEKRSNNGTFLNRQVMRIVASCIVVEYWHESLRYVFR